MKRIIAIATLALIISNIAGAQNEKKDVSWKERVEAEKIAYLTAEMDLTADEAQAFWPVYNKVKKVRDEVNEAMWDSFRALKDAMNTDASDKEIEKLLEEYLAASQMASTISAQYVKDYEKVLPARKVAKYYLVEEKFRKFQFNKLQGGQNRGGQPGQPGGQMRGGRPQGGQFPNGRPQGPRPEKFDGQPQGEPAQM